jgi:acetate kinase
MDDTILCLNAGSSSLKFATFTLGATEETRSAYGAIENMGGESRFWLKNARDEVAAEKQVSLPGPRESLEEVFRVLEKQKQPGPTAVGHRIVHGGSFYTAPVKIDADVLRTLKQLVPFAPVHLPAQIELIEAVATHYSHLPQVACFDTAFHSGMPEVARRLALPRNLWEQGIRRYGFHGLSYEYILSALGEQAKRRTIIAHLGNGASMAAILDGRPVDTTMGLTPAGGFMMSSRSGDLDPGVLVYLMGRGAGASDLEQLVDQQSGLLGVSGISGDMKILLEKRKSEPHAAQAVAMFCYAVRKYVGAFAAVLAGLDTLVFTGGMGEHASPVREEICRGLEFLGVAIDDQLNRQNAPVISRKQSRCEVRVMATDEDRMIARHTRATLRTSH